MCNKVQTNSLKTDEAKLSHSRYGVECLFPELIILMRQCVLFFETEEVIALTFKKNDETWNNIVTTR